MLNETKLKYSAKYDCHLGCKGYRSESRDKVKYTYIAKDANSDYYKIGRSVNLRERIASIRTCNYFGKRDYYLYAFTPCDIELSVQWAIIGAGGVPPKRRVEHGARPIEVFQLSHEDIELVIKYYRFHKVEGGMIPTAEISDKGRYRGLLCKYNIISWKKPCKKRIKKEAHGNL